MERWLQTGENDCQRCERLHQYTQAECMERCGGGMGSSTGDITAKDMATMAENTRQAIGRHEALRAYCGR
ncbi:MAG: hypothetical protein Q7O66_15540 [Dehalococcoidia bacterium]|nr:hypothetical protein [Dehalococcoidia bacterium]